MGQPGCNMSVIQGFVVFVVLASTAAKQEKINPKFPISNRFSSDAAFEYSSMFGFNPFTPFPELQSTTQRTATRITTTSQTKFFKKTRTQTKTQTSSRYWPKLWKSSSNKFQTNSSKSLSTNDWVNSILKRTTRKPFTTRSRPG